MFFRIYLFLFFMVFIAFFLYRNVFLFSRKTGEHPLSILRSGKLSRHMLLELILGVQYTALGIVIVGYSLNLAFMEQLGQIPILDRGWVKWLGVIDTLAFVLFFFPAIGQMGSCFRIGIDEGVKPELVTCGLFAYTRNPIFFGVFHMFLCVFLISPNYLSFFLVFAYYITITWQIREEERYLLSVLGEPYQRYLEAVPRFFPTLRPLNKNGQRLGKT